MGQQKSTNKIKRLTLAVWSLAFALALAFGGFVGVLAATIQAVGSHFNVEYEVGNNIAARVSAKYKIVGEEEVGMGEIVFSATDEYGTSYQRLTAPQTIELTGDKQSVTFTYTFENIGEQAFYADLDDKCSKRNVIVEYSDTSIIVEKGETKTVSITVKLNSVNFSANYTSGEEHGLIWILSATN